MNSAMGYTEGAEVPEDKTITDNELIARFMGRRYGKNADLNGYLKYDSSWDHLMPVVDKIEKETNCWFLRKPGSITVIERYAGQDLGIFDGCSISSWYKAVVEFIKWYNLESLKNKPI